MIQENGQKCKGVGLSSEKLKVYFGARIGLLIKCEDG